MQHDLQTGSCRNMRYAIAHCPAANDTKSLCFCHYLPFDGKRNCIAAAKT